MRAAAIQFVVEEVPLPVDSASGREEVLRQAVSTYEGLLVSYARSILGDAELARDVVQDCFLRLHRELAQGTPENLKGWLFRVCRNRAVDLLRKNRRFSVVGGEMLASVQDEEQASPAVRFEVKEAHERALMLLDRLTPNQREVIRLKFQADLSYKEISEVTGLSVGNVGYLLHHGLKQLRNWMHEEE